MERPVEIRAHQIELTEDARKLIHEKAEGLERFSSEIVGCEVYVEGPGQHHREGGTYRVRIRVHVPEHEIAVSHKESSALHPAISESFAAARRLLQDWVRKRRGFVKHHEEQPTANVVRLLPEKDCGFLETADGREIYFNRNSVLEPGFEHLEVGDQVRFAEEQGNEGPQASSLQVVRGGR